MMCMHYNQTSRKDSSTMPMPQKSWTSKRGSNNDQCLLHYLEAEKVCIIAYYIYIYVYVIMCVRLWAPSLPELLCILFLEGCIPRISPWLVSTQTPKWMVIRNEGVPISMSCQPCNAKQEALVNAKLAFINRDSIEFLCFSTGIEKPRGQFQQFLRHPEGR